MWSARFRDAIWCGSVEYADLFHMPVITYCHRRRIRDKRLRQSGHRQRAMNAGEEEEEEETFTRASQVTACEEHEDAVGSSATACTPLMAITLSRS